MCCASRATKKPRFPPDLPEGWSERKAPAERPGFLFDCSSLRGAKQRSNPGVGCTPPLDCFAELVIGPATSGRTRWLAMTSREFAESLAPAVDGDEARCRPLGRARRPWFWRARIRCVEAVLVADHLEAVGQAHHGLGGAEHQKTVAGGDARQPIEHVDLGLLVEIDQHVAAEDQIEDAEVGKVRQQVELAEFDHGADVRRDLPELTGLGKMLDQELDRQPALHLELAVEALDRKSVV